MTFWKRAAESRWRWFIGGLPSLPRAAALFRIRRATMTQVPRCRALWNQCQYVIRQKVPGAFVECGVWRGGSAGLMGLAARHAGEIRPLHLFDSFEGLPEPTEADEQAAADYSGGKASGNLKSIARCQAGLSEVEEFLFSKLRLDRSFVHFHVGWFQHTVPADASSLGPIAVLRLDGDWYESTRICLEHLYPKLSPGGVLILDDYYAWAGCKKATDEYRQQCRITAPIHRLDVDAVYWVKPTT